MDNTFSEKGFLIIRGGLTKKFIKSVHSELSKYWGNAKTTKNESCYSVFCEKIKNLKTSEYEFQRPIWDWLTYRKIVLNLLTEKKLFYTIKELLGPDLAYLDGPSLNVNIPGKNSPKKNYLFKDWHQEVWSGASINSIQIWTPLLQGTNIQGQIELMIDSHNWGIIPNRNRKPTELPKKYQTVKTDLEYGDVIIFSTLMLHRSITANYPRLSLTAQIRNFKNYNFSFQNVNSDWKIYASSELTKLEKKLGNHYLTPYRTDDGETENIPGSRVL